MPVAPVLPVALPGAPVAPVAPTPVAPVAPVLPATPRLPRAPRLPSFPLGPGTSGHILPQTVKSPRTFASPQTIKLSTHALHELFGQALETSDPSISSDQSDSARIELTGEKLITNVSTKKTRNCIEGIFFIPAPF